MQQCSFHAHGLRIKPIKRYDLKGNFVDQTEDRHKELTEMHEKYGMSPLLLGWHEIRQLLFEYLPAGVVDFDKQVRCVHVQHNSCWGS